jgi:MoaD family protein
MKVIAHFYAQLRDLIGEQKREIGLAEHATVSDLLQKLYGEFPALRAHDKTLLVGVGVEFVDRNYKLKAGDEIAIMPPVQGG